MLSWKSRLEEGAGPAQTTLVQACRTARRSDAESWETETSGSGPFALIFTFLFRELPEYEIRGYKVNRADFCEQTQRERLAILAAKIQLLLRSLTNFDEAFRAMKVSRSAMDFSRRMLPNTDSLVIMEAARGGSRLKQQKQPGDAARTRQTAAKSKK